MKKLTARMLERAGACARGVRQFTKIFPTGVIPTAELVGIIDMSKMDYVWLLMGALSERQQLSMNRSVTKALAAERTAVSFARAEYDREMNRLSNSTALTSDVQRARSDLQAVRDRRVRDARTEYQRARLRAFARAFQGKR